MEINLPLILLVLLIIAIGLYMVLNKNRKDRKELEHKLNHDYHKSKESEGDIETDEENNMK